MAGSTEIKWIQKLKTDKMAKSNKRNTKIKWMRDLINFIIS